MLRVLWKIALVLVMAHTLVYANNTTEASQESAALALEVAQLQERYTNVVKTIRETKNVWLYAYANYDAYQKLTRQLSQIESSIKQLKKERRSKKRDEEMVALEKKAQIVQSQLSLIPDVGERPFDALLALEELPKAPTVTNPIAIFTGLSFIKTLSQFKSAYLDKIGQLQKVITLINQEHDLLEELVYAGQEQYQERYAEAQLRLESFKSTLAILNSTALVYGKRIDDLLFKTEYQIQDQGKNLLQLAIIIGVLFAIAFAIKVIIRRYIKDHERFYMANKIVNFGNFIIIALVLTVRFIDNIEYFATVLGFASAGIAIAMRDWFMSILGWILIVMGGSIHVGDRVKFQKDGMEYVGDVLDISLFRITLMEDVTYTTYTTNRRAGRIIFVPNNYIFTSMIANYSHNSLKTVWDGIDITITFDSNHKKAAYLAKEIARKFSKGYTDITRKQLNKLRDKYSLKNTNVEPRVFTMVEPNGMRISTWYLTNAFATLTLRSSISAEIVDAFNKESDIHIAYPTQTVTTLHTTPHTSIPMAPMPTL